MLDGLAVAFGSLPWALDRGEEDIQHVVGKFISLFGVKHLLDASDFAKDLSEEELERLTFFQLDLEGTYQHRLPIRDVEGVAHRHREGDRDQFIVDELVESMRHRWLLRGAGKGRDKLEEDTKGCLLCCRITAVFAKVEDRL